MKTRFLTIMYAALGGALLLAVGPALPGLAVLSVDESRAAPSQTVSPQTVPSTQGSPADVLRVGPGRVSFEFSPTGEWFRFGPREGRALIGSGGFVVLARGPEGNVLEMVDTRAGGLRVLSGVRGIEKVHEGIENGRRYPSAHPDDDDDNYVDEDRLDGMDNDGDGRIDEDFAAIGDEMVVTAYEPLPDRSKNLPVVEIHQESYAWSLPQIDGMVVTRLTVRNTGQEPIEDIRLGAVFGKRAEFTVDSQDFGTVDGATGTPGQTLLVKGMLLHGGEESVAVMFFSPPAEGLDAASWLTGVSRAGRSIAALVDASTHPDVLARPELQSDGEESPLPSPSWESESEAQPQYVGFGVSPSLGALEPGGEAFMYVALVAPPSAERAAKAIDYAYRTVIGDGNSWLIPPPVSIKRRVIWGMYEVDLSGGVRITLLDPRARGINPMEIAFLKGIDLGRAVRSELPDGNAMFELSQDAPSEFADQEKVVMHGRLEDGEWFEAVLQPAIGLDGGTTISAEQYFGRTGKLDEAFITGSPNPFRDATTIAYEVPARLTDEFGNEVTLGGPIETSVKIYNVTGRLVSTLVETTHTPGRYQTQWSAQNESGASVASGVYYIKLQIGKRYVTKRLIQLK